MRFLQNAAFAIACAALVVAIVMISKSQLDNEKTGADVVCAQARATGRSCVVDPKTFNSQIISVGEGTSTRTFLVISDDKKNPIAVLPLE